MKIGESYHQDGGGFEKKLKQILAENTTVTGIIDEKAYKAINRIKSKLNGKDFKNKIPLKVEEQVEKLIKQSTSHENICQSFIGWNPFL